jgi:predicted glycogen debranching enzyme
MSDVVRRIALAEHRPARELARDEWLVANGVGGYASGAISGAITRRYHGVLVAALPVPLGRLVMLSQVADAIVFPDGATVRLSADAEPASDGDATLVEFRLEAHLPVWRYEARGLTIEKRLFMPNRQNIVHVIYRLVGAPDADPVRIRLRPLVQFRPLEAPVDSAPGADYVVSAAGNRYEISAGPNLPALRLMPQGQRIAMILDGGARRELFYPVEAERGYEACGSVWTPGYFTGELSQGQDVVLSAGTEPWHAFEALPPQQALEYETRRRHRLVEQAPEPLRSGAAAELVLAADSFVITPLPRIADMVRAQAAGDDIRTVIAGYHWFTDWGRDTMISLEGLTLSTNRAIEAGWILRTFAHYVRDGLIPNMFPEGRDQGLYHTADATLWFFHALDRYVAATGDRTTLRQILPVLRDIVDHHRRGTRFGIGVDPDDGLLRQGEPGYQLTWMDAKVGDWVVTPRRGKAVEINALWYNALRLLSRWLEEEGDPAAARPLADAAEQVFASFNGRFWNERNGYLFDVVDAEHGDDDPACRPNQIFAVSLPNPVLQRDCWEPVVETVRRRLLTPVGLRSLAPGHPDYKPRYTGDLRARDAAYHQGTVWAWLIGPFVDAWLKLHPDNREEARRFLDGFTRLDEVGGIGTIAEIFDAEPPFTPRGCMSQAWSVAEVLRCWLKTSASPSEQDGDHQSGRTT